jgi:hypothetical protein
MSYIDDQLKALTSADTSAEKKQKIYQRLSDETAPNNSLLGAGLGGLAGGLGALALGYPAGRLLGHAVRKPIANKLEAMTMKDGNLTLAEVGANMEKAGKATLERFTDPVKLAEAKMAAEMGGINDKWFDRIGGVAKWTGRQAENMGSVLKEGKPGMDKLTRDAFGIGTGFIGGNVGALYGAGIGGQAMADQSQRNPEADAALQKILDPSTPAEEKQALMNAYRSHYGQLQDQKGSAMLGALVNAGISIPLGFKFHSGAVANAGKKMIPDEFLQKNPALGTKFARDLLVESAGDVAVASPLGAVGGTLAYNLTGNKDYEDPFGAG